MTHAFDPPERGLPPAGWAAAQETYLRSGRLLTASLTTMLRSRENAQDAIQEALFALASNLATIKDPSPAKLDAWVRRVAVNKAMSSYRRTRRFQLSGSSNDIADTWKQLASHLPPHDQAAAREALRFISRLPNRQRIQRAQATIDKKFVNEPSPAYQQIVTRLRGREDKA